MQQCQGEMCSLLWALCLQLKIFMCQRFFLFCFEGCSLQDEFPFVSKPEICCLLYTALLAFQRVSLPTICCSFLGFFSQNNFNIILIFLIYIFNIHY